MDAMGDLYSDNQQERLKQIDHDRRLMRNTRKNRALLQAYIELKTGRPYLVPTSEMIAVSASVIFGQAIPSEEAKEFYGAYLRSITLFSEDTQQSFRNPNTSNRAGHVS